MDAFEMNSLRDRLHRQHLLLRFHQGCCISKERVYDTEHDDAETLSAFRLFTGLVATYEPTGKCILDRSIIGRGFKGVLPWEDVPAITEYHRQVSEQGQDEDPTVQAERFESSTTLRVSDVRAGNDGTITIEFKSSK